MLKSQYIKSRMTDACIARSRTYVCI